MEAENQLLPRALNTTAPPRAAAAPLSISVEWLAYLGLALVALFFRISALDAVPLNDAEARQSLHALHSLQGNAPGTFAAASSPITHLVQLLSFSLLGASEFSARIGTALAGTALALSPLLFRHSIGRTRTFIWALLLSVLTIPIAASRLVDGTVWMMLFTVLAIWMIRRYWYSRQLSDALWASAFVTLMLLLSSPAGIPLLLILLAAGWLAVWRTALSAPQRLDLPGDDILQIARQRLADFPFAKAAFVPFLTVFIVATAAMFNPSGLRTVSQLLDSAFAGFSQPASADGIRLGFAALLVYEPLLVIFALGGAWLLWKHGDVTYIDRFAAAWAALAALGLILYPGARAADALWVVVPLSLLASYGITQLMVNRLVAAFWQNNADGDSGDAENSASPLYSPHYSWVKWVIALGVLLFLFIIAVHFLQVARALLNLPPSTSPADLPALLARSSQARLAQGLGMLMMTALIFALVYVLLANFWGHGTVLQGIGIGFFGLMLLSGLGGAWRAAVVADENAVELWQQPAIAKDARLLRETLFELASRDAKGFPLLEIRAITDGGGIIRADGLLAWLLRDFSEARFVGSIEMAAGAPIILAAQNSSSTPALEGSYVGQRFVLRRHGALVQLGLWDLPAWWSHRRHRQLQTALEDSVILWLRQDVYDGASLIGRP